MKQFFDKLYTGSFEDFILTLGESLKNGKKTFVVTANPEAFICGKQNDEIKSLLLDEETTVVADGIGVVKGARIMGVSVKERIPGVDIASSLLRLGNENNKSIFLLGARQEVSDLMCKVIERDYPNIKILGAVNGYVEDKDKVFDQIKVLSPDIVLVALGVPTQETLIYRHIKDFDKGIFVGVGGSLDVLSGAKKRAPKFFIKHYLEWLYRIIREPSRIKRFYNNNIKFLCQIRKEKNR